MRQFFRVLWFLAPILILMAVGVVVVFGLVLFRGTAVRIR